jgi:membrane fusion protein, heavy metal efflux system
VRIAVMFQAAPGISSLPRDWIVLPTDWTLGLLRFLMSPARNASLLRGLAVVASIAVLVVLLVAAMPLVGGPSLFARFGGKAGVTASQPAHEEERLSPAEPVPGDPDAFRLPPDTVAALRLRTVPAERSTIPRQLELSGQLALDANTLARVHSRFAGEVVRVEEVADNSAGSQTTFRQLRPGDHVDAGQLLAVVWSKDLGEKKSQLIDAISQLRLDQETLDRYEELARSGSISEVAIRGQRRQVEADRITLATAERTLRSWKLSEEEIEAIRADADRLRQPAKPADKEKDRDWAKVEVRARSAGTVVERNLAPGDIVDTTTDLFKIADLSRLAVWAYVYEEDLPALLSLSPEQMRWTIRLKADPEATPLAGGVEYVGEIIDPNQHTALARGSVENKYGRLRAGQFITATMQLPPPPNEVVIPGNALVEDGREAIIFVQPEPAEPRYALRRVAVARRLPDGRVTLRTRLQPDEERRGLRTVRAGEAVVTSGVVELKAALEDLQGGAPRDK